MKKLLLLFIFNLALIFSSLGQAGVASSKLSFQGIARDNTNNALADRTNLPISVTLFYGAGTDERTILTAQDNVNTDAFGVFSYKMTLDSSYFKKVSNVEAWIRIASNGVTFVQEQLRTVPYAIHAQNGVPTGTIMPYVGSTAPEGWLMCDGTTIPNNDPYYAGLYAIWGSSTPNLKGLFLQGTGSNSGYSSTYVGPTLRTTNTDDIKSHTHSVTASGTTPTNGVHQHDAKWNLGYGPPLNSFARAQSSRINSHQDPLKDVGGVENDASWVDFTSSAGDHTHSLNVTGAMNTTTTTSGFDVETRPVNFGVNYIIKI
jgi:microcystin-dependent protein